ncbi:SDR family NAD(P)-dependent oxidoreductase [Hahella sp. KA22]|uniref:NAD-dependent 4,6-dehydratase LegB n=1 Tax=Hahella sp. KA22 TaxID=1628392 RepID=UPI000FDE8925|nr:NAD-dependent 4,6-dehydratase LegB [Hahella sp. KA22]AZZ91270.1 SDR family NAD(P)-dependent oxidoreductase [Hahella sp. KA22]QAY54639.1 SDR family NAD(P)-dependent oxidoreductase [Hahella sp. KA22]
MKTALVTGADGFIGSHLVEMLHARGYQVRALSYYNSFNDWGWLEQSACLKDLDVWNGDIRDPHYCIELTKGVDVVFNLAALIGIPYSYTAPDTYVDVNIRGTVNICQGARLNGVGRLVHASTSEVYGTAKYAPIDEKHPLQPQSPYSASKIGAESMALSFHNAFQLPVTVARPFNTYGPRQSARAVIPTIISQIAAGKSSIKLGDPSPTRDFNFVEDTCLGFIELAECEQAIGQVVNIGSNTEISIGDTFELICRLMQAEVVMETDQQRARPANSEVFRLKCDNALIKSLTGYEPKFNLEQGLRKTIDWFTRPENLRRYKADIYNV